MLSTAAGVSSLRALKMTTIMGAFHHVCKKCVCMKMCVRVCGRTHACMRVCVCVCVYVVDTRILINTSKTQCSGRPSGPISLIDSSGASRGQAAGFQLD